MRLVQNHGKILAACVRKDRALVERIKLNFDFIDFNRRIRLSMTLLATKPFATLVLEDENFRGLALCNDMPAYGDIAQDRLSDLYFFAIGIKQNGVKRYFLPDVTCQLFNPQGFPFFDSKLFAARFNYSVHAALL
jgi:hypothetical protein